MFDWQMFVGFIFCSPEWDSRSFLWAGATFARELRPVNITSHHVKELSDDRLAEYPEK
jgi:hypothetical protein